MLSHLQNTSDERINPATEDKQDDIVTAVGGGVTVGAVGTADTGVGESKELLAAATGRRSVILTNVSDTVVYIGVGTAAVSARGIPLAAAVDGVGGTVEITGPAAALVINGYASAAKAVAYQTFSIA